MHDISLSCQFYTRCGAIKVTPPCDSNRMRRRSQRRSAFLSFPAGFVTLRLMMKENGQTTRQPIQCVHVKKRSAKDESEAAR